MLLLPLPCMLEELLAGDILLADALGLQLGHHLAFSSYGSMVRSRDPAGVLPVHPGLAHKYVIQCIVQHMPHMKYPGHVRWRYDYRIWFSLIRFRMEKLVLKPIGVPFVLYFCRTVLCRKFHKVSVSYY